MTASLNSYLSQPLSVRIRNGCENDAPALQNLLIQLGYQLTETDLKNRVNLYTSTSNFALFVAEVSNQVVGLVALSMRELFIIPRKNCCIEGLVIDEAYRGQGIGQMLIKTAEDYARLRQCRVIELTSGLRRAPDGTHDFYNKLGYKNEGHYAKLYLRKELD